MNDQKKEKVQQLRAMWDERYEDQDKIPRPAEVLLSNSHLLPSNGSALDLACGLGGNAMHLAALGLDVVAWDLSPVAIQRLQQLAQEKSLQNLKAEVWDVERHPPSVNQFDVIVVSYYLERSLITSLINALKPGGLIYYQTFIRDAVSSEGPKNSNFRLADQELLRLFNKLKIRLYREEGRLGDPTRGTRDVAMLVAEK
ncbi:MAG: class I SAM-dependent methyltransferase [Candidatus Thiodiazotropha sp. LLP2]